MNSLLRPALGLILIPWAAAWLVAGDAAPLPLVSARVRLRDGATLALGSAIPIVLEIVNPTGSDLIPMWRYPYINDFHFFVVDPDGGIHVQNKHNEPHEGIGLVTTIKFASTYSVPLFLASTCNFTKPGEWLLEWEFDLTDYSPNNRNGAPPLARGSIALHLIAGNEHDADDRVKALLQRYLAIAGGAAPEHQERVEIVQELLGTKGDAAVQALGEIVHNFIGMAESGPTIIRALGERDSTPQVQAVIRSALSSGFSSVVEESLGIYLRQQTMIDQATFRKLLASTNPGVQWVALNYLQRLADITPPSTLKRLHEERFFSLRDILALRESESKELGALAEKVARSIATLIGVALPEKSPVK